MLLQKISLFSDSHLVATDILSLFRLPVKDRQWLIPLHFIVLFNEFLMSLVQNLEGYPCYFMLF